VGADKPRKFDQAQKELTTVHGSRSTVPRRGAKMREIVTLQCTECKERNYSTTKNKKTTTGRLEFKKFCSRCRKHQVHKETK
jgi:large subunit ribosomal protein L33